MDAHNGLYKEETFPARGCPPERWQGNLLFALKHEGVNIEVLRAFFAKVNAEELVAFICDRPQSRYGRRAWFFYEFLTGRELPIPSLQRGSYEFALDPKKYVTLPASEATYVKRQRILNNLLGPAELCPVVRLTPRIQAGLTQDFSTKVSDVLSHYPAELVYRANQYLYLKETKSSFAIERQTPDQRRTSAFMAILEMAGREPLTESFLVRLQNAIVEPRYAEHGFRNVQVYVGQTLTPERELVHFVGVRPQDLPALMAAFLKMADVLLTSQVHPIVAAALISFLFVFIHPFDDGNGRLHRYLLHHVLVAKRFSPENLTFPISAVLHRQVKRYDGMLESFSKRLMEHIQYSLDEHGAMTIAQETIDFYRHIDCTWIAEEIFDVVSETLKTELIPELEHLVLWDQMLHRIRQVIDMPDRRAQLFVRLVLNNNGKLSAGKRSQFPELQDSEIAALEACVAEVRNSQR